MTYVAYQWVCRKQHNFVYAVNLIMTQMEDGQPQALYGNVERAFIALDCRHQSSSSFDKLFSERNKAALRPLAAEAVSVSPYQ
jgi:hypothetical protein